MTKAEMKGNEAEYKGERSGPTWMGTLLSPMSLGQRFDPVNLHAGQWHLQT